MPMQKSARMAGWGCFQGDFLPVSLPRPGLFSVCPSGKGEVSKLQGASVLRIRAGGFSIPRMALHLGMHAVLSRKVWRPFLHFGMILGRGGKLDDVRKRTI